MTQQWPHFRGIITAMITPLTDQHTLNRQGLERLIEHLIAGGVHGLFPLGTTGEASALPMELRMDMITQVCRLAEGRVPVVVCVTDTSLVEATRLALKAKDCGAAAISTAPPNYYPITQDEILRYVEKLVRQAGMPLLLYNAPGNTHHTIAPDTVRRAAEIENIVGLKDSGMDMNYFRELHGGLASRGDFSLLVGPEELLAECILLGGHGSMAAGSNIYPRLFVDLYNAAAAGDIARVKTLHQEVLEFGHAIYHGNNPFRGLKCGLGLLGICSSLLSDPLADYSREKRAIVERYIDQHRTAILAYEQSSIPVDTAVQLRDPGKDRKREHPAATSDEKPGIGERYQA
ncbi:MAG: dihydrodipicolinate synthase family protein [Candidatus Acidiferrum sp.]|jgi:4-hydroxy-tetrahydrodipicolinate synthase